MAYKSDMIVKQELQSVGSMGDLKLRIFPGDSRDDQLHWVDGGLCFGKRDWMYGSCDGAWYVDEPFKDPLTGETTSQKPIIAVEGTLALERGSSGDAQYQRFFHVLGAVMSGVIGVYYLRAGKHPMRPDLPQAAIHATEKHGCPYLVVNDLSDIQQLVFSIAKYGQDSGEVTSVIERVITQMRRYWESAFERQYKSDIQKYYQSRSIILTPQNQYIKYAGRNLRNFTESSQRAGHIALGEFYLAKYFLAQKFYYFLTRLSKEEVQKLNARNAKEWKLMRSDDLGTIMTIEDFNGITQEIKEGLESLKDTPLKGQSMKLHRLLMKLFRENIESGNITLKEKII
jgi:hypothetical protein